MKSVTKRKSPVLDTDGYEKTPPGIAKDMDAAFAAGPMPADFLPPISKLEFRTPKKATSIRIDADVLDWFQSMGKGYQTKINAVLRAYKQAHGSS